ncbi:MAG: aspartate aminotransferase family protein [Dehalococcoidia bacterium]|nr:aspartate aminotransferase family protein [Dehalococcoidia bacterium]
MVFEQTQDEIKTYVASTPTSRELQHEAAQYLPGGSSRGTAYFDPYPFFVDHAAGHHVYDVDGNRYLDFMLNATTYIVGHAHPLVVKAVQEQAAKGFSYSTPTEAQIRLARMLCERVSSVDMIRFTNSGTEGTLNAIRAARAVTGKHKIAKFEGGYHGSHEYVSVSVAPPLDKLDPNGPSAIPEYPGQPPSVLEDVIVLPYNDLIGSEQIIRQHRDELACVIMEPVCSNFGYVPAQPEFLSGMRDLTKQLGVVLIFDEVQSFRLASGGAQESFGITPDLTTFGKVIGGGLPVGAWGGRADLMALYDPARESAVPHSGTFNANPLTMVAGEATLAQLTLETYQRMNALGDMLREQLGAVFEESGVPAQVTGIGSLFGFHFTAGEVTDHRSMLRGDQELKARVYAGLLNEGLLLSSNCTGALSTVTSESEINELIDAMRRVMQRIRG